MEANKLSELRWRGGGWRESKAARVCRQYQSEECCIERIPDICSGFAWSVLQSEHMRKLSEARGRNSAFCSRSIGNGTCSQWPDWKSLIICGALGGVLKLVLPQ